MPECYIRGSTIKYLRLPDEVIDLVKEEVVARGRGRGENRGRGGPGRGRGGPGRGKQVSLMSPRAVLLVAMRIVCFNLLYSFKLVPS